MATLLELAGLYAHARNNIALFEKIESELRPYLEQAELPTNETVTRVLACIDVMTHRYDLEWSLRRVMADMEREEERLARLDAEAQTRTEEGSL